MPGNKKNKTSGNKSAKKKPTAKKIKKNRPRKPDKKKTTSLLRRLTKRGLKFLLGTIIFAALFSILQVAVYKYINPPITVPMLYSWYKNKINHTPYHGPSFKWRSLADISPNLRKAILAGEDQRFLTHNGFDFIEIKNAAKDVVFGKRLRGASTISMQTARTVYLLPSRSFTRKLLEAYYTVLIETLWSKKRILEVYLNTVDWGTGIMGAEAAALAYFKKPASRLTQKQAGLLVSILPNPHKWNPNRPNTTVKSHLKRITKNIHAMPLL